MNLFGKSGGYRTLDSFTLASVIQLATWRFCKTRSLNFTPTHIAKRAPIFIPCRPHRQ